MYFAIFSFSFANINVTCHLLLNKTYFINIDAKEKKLYITFNIYRINSFNKCLFL